MSTHDRICEAVSPDRQVIMIGEGPAEIASWFFPHKSNEDEPLSTATEELLDERIATHLTNRPMTAAGNDVLLYCR